MNKQKTDITLPTKIHIVKAMLFFFFFPVVMCRCKSWTIKTAELRAEELMLWTVKLGKTLERPLGCKIKPVNLKGNQPWIFIGRTDAEAGASILWPPATKSWLIWKDTDAGKYWTQEEQGMTENEMVEWHHPVNGHQFEQTCGDGDGQGGLQSMGSQSQMWLSDWTIHIHTPIYIHIYLHMFETTSQ